MENIEPGYGKSTAVTREEREFIFAICREYAAKRYFFTPAT